MAASVGIDFGTTNTVVAWADRGNYPVLALSGDGAARLSMPTVMAWREGGGEEGAAVRFGWEALRFWDEPGWQLLSSPKRWLGTPEPALPDLAGDAPPGAALEELLRQFFRRLREEILACPHLEGEEEIEAMVGVPANANSLQRLRTLEAARRAGFRVLGLCHEPTAAALEYAHRHPAFGRGKERRHVLVYDLGGGTFDVAVVRADPDGFSVLCSAGVERLGGDDFDEVMAELALGKAGLCLAALPPAARHRLLLRCREAKEALRPTTKKWLIDLGDMLPGGAAGEVPVYMTEFAERCQPLLDRTIEVLSGVLARSQIDLEELDALLLCGGGGQLPLVQRRLKELCGSRLKISPHPFASTAVGLAIHAERSQDQPARERLPHTELPEAGEVLEVRRAYQPAHNIGHFRFEECAALAEAGEPAGDRTAWCEIRFPFDPALSTSELIDDLPVLRMADVSPHRVEERYQCDSQGLITVRLRREEPPLERAYLLYGPERVAPVHVRSARERKGPPRKGQVLGANPFEPTGNAPGR